MSDIALIVLVLVGLVGSGKVLDDTSYQVLM
jgi:hypothetical protein